MAVNYWSGETFKSHVIKNNHGLLEPMVLAFNQKEEKIEFKFKEVLLIIVLSVATVVMVSELLNQWNQNHPKAEIKNEIIQTVQAEELEIKPIQVFPKVITGPVRKVTAYNVGRPEQTDSTPCISANGENICLALERGYKRAASGYDANGKLCYKHGTRLNLESLGEVLVTDTMNRKYTNCELDIAMPADQVNKAFEFGHKLLAVEIIK